MKEKEKKEEKQGILNKIKYAIFEEVYVTDINIQEEKEVIIDNKIYEIKEKKKLTDKDYKKLEEYNNNLEEEEIKIRKSAGRAIKIALLMSIITVLICFIISFKNNTIHIERIKSFADIFAMITAPIPIGSFLLINLLDGIIAIIIFMCFVDVKQFKRNIKSDLIIINKYIFFEVIILFIISIIYLGLTYHYREIFTIREFVNRIIFLIISTYILIDLISTNNKIIKKLADTNKGIV